MKVIDLLNKIANIEEVPKKIRIKFKGFSGYDYYKYDETFNWYVTFDESTIMQIGEITDLNSEVEIIEEDKPIENNNLQYVCCNSDLESGHIVTILNDFFKENDKVINEIIDKLNKLEDKEVNE